MADRKDVMIAQDLVRYANIINDCLDAMTYTARGLRADTGAVKILKSSGSPMTTENKINDIRGHQTAAQVYADAIPAYLGKLGRERVSAALATMGIDYDDFVSDFGALSSSLGTATATQLRDDTDLENLAKWIDDNVEKLPLIRRRWAL